MVLKQKGLSGLSYGHNDEEDLSLRPHPPPSGRGLDMEIEFENNNGKLTAKKLYLQLKSGDSHLRRRNTDGAEIFQIHHPDHAAYWMNQAYPVFLVIADSKGNVRWMEIRDYLRRESEGGAKPVKHIVFKGERFDVMAVRCWRDYALSQPSP